MPADNESADAVVKQGGRLRRWLRRVVIGCLLILLLILVLLFGLSAWEESVTFDTEAAAGITYTPLRQIVPGPGLPSDLELMRSNNNLDIVDFEGRVYMAFRTAPCHFASESAKIVIMSSADREQWTLESEIALGRDVREPRLLVFKGNLFLYFFDAGTALTKFEPHYIHVCERTDSGWSQPREVFGPGYVVWRVRKAGGRAYMSVYNGTSLYGPGDTPSDLRLLVSDDGLTFTRAFPDAQVNELGAEEADFGFDEAGNLVAVVRQEVRCGSMVCTASKEDLSHWECTFSPYKVDSALLFRHGGTFYVIGRRNVAGPCDRGLSFLPGKLNYALSMAMYSLTRKRTTLYRVDIENKRMVPLFDFPSCGDTAFAGIVPLDEYSYYVVNYSTDIAGRDWPWLAGQFIGANLYETVLRFPVPR